MRLQTLLLATVFLVCGRNALAQAGSTLAWEEDPDSTVTGFAVVIDGFRTDYSLAPLAADLTCGCSIPLPFAGGRHSVVVIAYNTLGDAASSPLTVEPIGDAGGPYTGVSGLAMTVDASGSKAPTGGIVAYAWTWGDGTSSSGVSPVTSHTYVATGTYVVTLTIIDSAGAGATARTTATIVAANLAPRVVLTSPVNGTIVTAPGNVTVAATAADDDGTIRGVEFYAGTAQLGAATTAPYQVSWNGVPAGRYTVTAVATDDGGRSTMSERVTFTVNASPTVAVTAPTNGLTVRMPGSIVLSAAAKDSDGTVTHVAFYAGSKLIGETSRAPYAVVWADVRSGTYSLTAIATDDRGATGRSLRVWIRVKGR